MDMHIPLFQNKEKKGQKTTAFQTIFKDISTEHCFQ